MSGWGRGALSQSRVVRNSVGARVPPAGANFSVGDAVRVTPLSTRSPQLIRSVTDCVTDRRRPVSRSPVPLPAVWRRGSASWLCPSERGQAGRRLPDLARQAQRGATRMWCAGSCRAAAQCQLLRAAPRSDGSPRNLILAVAAACSRLLLEGLPPMFVGSPIGDTMGRLRATIPR